MLKSRSPARACRNENGWREPRCTLAPARYRSNGSCCSTAPPAVDARSRPPALQDADASAVRQAETADVQRVRRGVFTAPRLLTMVNIAAGKAAEMIDLTQIARHQLTGQRLRLLLNVQRAAQRQRAAGEKTTAQLHRAKIRHPHHVTQRAASLAVGHRPAGDKPPAIGFRQQGGALVCRQPAQLKRRQPAWDRPAPAAPADSGAAADCGIPTGPRRAARPAPAASFLSRPLPSIDQVNIMAARQRFHMVCYAL